MFMAQKVIFEVLRLSGFFRYQYAVDPSPDNELLMYRSALWVGVLSVPYIVVLVLATLWWISGTRPRRVGVWSWRWANNLSLGFFVWGILTPLVFAIHYGAHYVHESAFGFPRHLHPLEQIFREEAASVEWAMLVAQAIFMAPLLEEVLFRGVLLPWLAKGPFRSAAVWFVALGLALIRYDSKIPMESLIAVAFVMIAGAVGALATSREPGPEWRWRAILGSSILFAMFHVDAWPAPVPLFFLALGLGWLAQRTRSLVGPIVLHSLFNAVSTIMLLRGIDV